MKVIAGNGCYTNYGNQAHVTRRLNEQVVTTAVDRTTAKKLGDMHVTHAPQQTCPPDCVLYPVTEGDIRGKAREELALTLAEQEASFIDDFSGERPARIHVVGDCQTVRAANTVGGAMVRFEERTGETAYTYCHAWRNVPYSAWMGARVIASCETAEDIRLATGEMGYPSAEWTYMEHISRKVHEREGIKVLPCPNNFNPQVPCDMCMKCADIELLKEKQWVIGLHGHGAVRQLRESLERRQNEKAEQDEKDSGVTPGTGEPPNLVRV